MAENRLNREQETRESKARPKSWAPPELLPSPNPQKGWEFRWVRFATQGQLDPTNFSSKTREGWEPVTQAECPEIQLLTTEDDRFVDNIVMGGLVLCKMPKEMYDERAAYYQRQAASQMETVDNNFMRESNEKMPLFKERRSEVSFGAR